MKTAELFKQLDEVEEKLRRRTKNRNSYLKRKKELLKRIEKLNEGNKI